jgi:hypothetical protein
MKKSVALACIAIASLLSACDLDAPAQGTHDIQELCLQDGFTPCRDQPPGSLVD